MRWLLACAALFWASAAQAQEVTLATGGVTGVYYPTGGAICRMVNQSRDLHGLRCTVRHSAGSRANIAALQAGEVSMALAQADALDGALDGAEGLSVLVSLHPEPLTILARAGARISEVEDLIGMRLALPDPQSGSRVTFDALLTALGWTVEDFADTPVVPVDEQTAALCQGDVDVIVQTVGHPSNAIQEATTTCDTRIVRLTGPVIDGLVAGNRSYEKIYIPGGTYPGNAVDVDTFATTAQLVAPTDTPDAVVLAVLTAIFGAGEGFTGLLPTLLPLTPGAMIPRGPLPLHPAAELFYQEQRWLP